MAAPVPGDVSPGGTHHFDSDDWGWRDLWVTAGEVSGLVASMFGVRVTGPVQLLGEGMLNQSWHVPCADHDRVLRVGRRERTPELVRSEHVAATAWAAVAPALVVAENDHVPVIDGHTLTLFPLVHGESGQAVDAGTRTAAMVPVVAALHRASLALGLPQRPGFTAVDDRPRWFGWEHARLAIMARFGTGPDVQRPLAVIDQATAHVDDMLDGWLAEGRLAMRATVHGDLNPRNQLYRDGALVGLIDTDDCRVEPLVWDVANLAYSHPDVRADEVWRLYRAEGGPVADADGEMLATFARIGALSEIMWLQDGDAPGEGAATHLALRTVTALAAKLSGPVHRDG
jgi:Ser/Thr protein kinase RdoA (MazF antagonist)